MITKDLSIDFDRKADRFKRWEMDTTSKNAEQMNSEGKCSEQSQRVNVAKQIIPKPQAKIE